MKYNKNIFIQFFKFYTTVITFYCGVLILSVSWLLRKRNIVWNIIIRGWDYWIESLFCNVMSSYDVIIFMEDRKHLCGWMCGLLTGRSGLSQTEIILKDICAHWHVIGQFPCLSWFSSQCFPKVHQGNLWDCYWSCCYWPSVLFNDQLTMQITKGIKGNIDGGNGVNNI